MILPTTRRTAALLLATLAAALLSACGRHQKPAEIGYVSVPQAFLRDRVATVYSKTGTVKNGDRVELFERERRFVRVRTDTGLEGWIEQRYIVSQEVYAGFQKLAQQEQNDPLQATGTTRNDTNIHLEPGREAEHLYQLNQGTKVSIFKRGNAEKMLPGALPQPANNETAKPAILEDWWLIRDPQGHMGWVLARMVDIDAPLEIAQYAEGQRIVAFFVLDQVNDGDKKVAQYLVALTEPKDGLPFDYNQVRVFTWNIKRHRYETAYREHNLNGVMPVTVSQENFENEGTLPVFILRVKDEDGNVSERKYKLNTPIVRRVLAPGEQPTKPVAKKRRRNT
ncbi:MAG TPA: SH3 domain-containing protein [Terriglobales bacterium]|nr:SH3 domain-containing protein [Terriglobales bacterium]